MTQHPDSGEDKLGKLKRGRLLINGLQPVAFEEVLDVSQPVDSELQALALHVVGVVRDYVKAAERLLNGEYADQRERAPVHLRSPGNVLVLACTDGVVIRFDALIDRTRLGWGVLDETLTDAVPKISGAAVFITPPGQAIQAEKMGVEIVLTLQKSAGVAQELARFKIAATTEMPAGPPAIGPSKRPVAALSIANEWSFAVEGEMLGKQESSGPRFVVEQKMRLPVGWEGIEVYPNTTVADWPEGFADAWAERDILASIAANHVRERGLHDLDPNANARRKFAALFAEYEALLATNPMEESLQVFLGDHPHLLVPTYKGFWKKLAFGATVSDFVFRDPAGDYVLIELERSNQPLFRKDGHPSAQLTHAVGQTDDWKRYIADNKRTVEQELGLSGISVVPECVVVIGRSASLSSKDKDKLVTMGNSSPKLRILTYDNVLDRAKAAVENLFGPLWAPDVNVYYLP